MDVSVNLVLLIIDVYKQKDLTWREPMKTSFIKIATAVGLACAISAPAVASNNQFQVIPAIGYTWYDNDTNLGGADLDDSEFFGLGFGYGFTDNFTLEAWYTNGDTDLEAFSSDIDVESIRLDARYDLPHFGNSNWNPYIVGGVGRANYDGAGFDEDATQINLGLGIKSQISERFSIRGDVRALSLIHI